MSPLLKAKNKKIHPYSENKVQINEKYENEQLINKHLVQVHDLPKNKYMAASPKIITEMEKETKVEKSPSVESNILDEIKFADDDDEGDFLENQCNNDVAYQDSNIISSS